MKKLLFMIIVLTLIVGCSAEKNDEPLKEETDVKVEEIAEEQIVEEEMTIEEETVEEEMVTETEVFTQESLAKYNGKDGMPGYVAVDGVVYDVSDVESWQNPHQGKHEPGKDYSEIMRKAPHGLKKLEGLPIVGTYE